ARQLQLITDALPVLISYLDREERYQFVNSSYEAWFGQRPAQLLGQRVQEVVGPAAYAGIKGYIDRAMAGERLEFEARMPYRQDFVKHIRTNYVPDVRAGEHEAERQRAVLHTLFMNAPAAICIFAGPDLVYEL
nr:hypothetical protein [Tanacetum cinerariifolium]